jgi:cytosine/adenosine deaminase-related metal-dependent hydrolase
MILRGLELVGTDRPRCDVGVSGGMFTRVGQVESRRPAEAPVEAEVAFTDAIACPGLVNSHDHLEFDLYPSLGHRHYGDYVEWGADIHSRDAKTIAAIESLPRRLRLEWGALKNLLAGVTTAAHHGPTTDDVALASLPIACVQRGSSIHSLRLGGHWRWRLNAPWPREPYVFHVAEGTSDAARREVDELVRWNLFGRELVAVHALAMNEARADRFRAVVWCPLSNEFLFGATADVGRLKARTAILFGTDSTLTADWNLWVHLRRARASGVLSDEELFASLTSTPAEVWRLPQVGRIDEGHVASLLVARKKRENRWDAFFAIDPEDLLLVLHRGVVLLVDASVQDVEVAAPSTRIRINGSEKRVAADVGRLLERIRAQGVEPNVPIALA